MSALKLYFALVQKDSPVQISVHRDLTTLQGIWQQEKSDKSVGIIHVGFVRPSIKNEDELTRHKGKVLTSVAAKWALPPEYRSSVAVVAELKLATQTVPLHQLLQGLGCDSPEPSASYKLTTITGGTSSKLTIAEAALSVLNDSPGPLNAEEIFARIVDQDLYHFGAEKPVSVLAVELNRHTRDTAYSNHATNTLFYKIDDGRFCSLEKEAVELSGWVKQLADERPQLATVAGSFGVYSEPGYKKLALSLPGDLRDQLDFYRFSCLANKIDITDPTALIRILPHRFVTSHVGSLGLPVRIYNVFREQHVECLADLSEVSPDDMLKWDNFGKGSLKDLCATLNQMVEKHADQLLLHGTTNTIREEPNSTEQSDQDDEDYQVELASTIPLRSHFANALADLKDIQRQVIECRTGYNGSVMTLETVGEIVGVTRERIRQIQKKYVKRIIETAFWDDCIAIKIGQLLIDRTMPLYIEMLEIEDPWFEGFMGNYQHLAAIIELFSENEIRVVNINGASVVTRIKSDSWRDSVSHFKKSLKIKAEEGGWTRSDIETTFLAGLSERGGAELVSLIWDQLEDAMQFEGESDSARLVAFGVSADSVIQAVLQKAEEPLHFTEIAERATKILGKRVTDLAAQRALMSQGAKLYGRGIYGLEKFHPISERMCKNIQLVVEELICKGPLMKQWHVSEILVLLQAKFSALPAELDNYILNIILQDSVKLVYLNRMVWGRADSKQTKNDRVDMADAFTRILEEGGGPLKGKEIKERLAAIRGVLKNTQLQPTERMIQIGPDYWGLIERDVCGTDAENKKKLDALWQQLDKRQKGIHVSEVEQFVEVSDESKDLPSAYTLLNLAQRDDRLHLGRSMYLGLAEWRGDPRRLNTSQAVRRLLDSMTKPMTISEIHARVEDITEMPVNGTVTGILIDEGAVYSQELKMWRAS
jgi:hypothetical protein